MTNGLILEADDDGVNICIKYKLFETQKGNLRYEVSTAVKTSILIFWFVTQCGLVSRY